MKRNVIMKRTASFMKSTAIIVGLALMTWGAIAPGDVAAQASGELAAADGSELTPEMKLGQRLLTDARLSNPGTNIQASCASCHVPPWLEAGRAFADDKPRSVLPTSPRALENNLTLRNTPTLLDTASHRLYNWDGRYMTLEDLLADKLTGPHMGWDREQGEQAIAELANILRNDAGEGLFAEGSYREQFESAVGVDLSELDDVRIHAWAVRVLSNTVRSLKSSRKSPWDAFLAVNRLAPGPSDTETPELYAGRILNRIENQTARRLLKRPDAMGDSGLKGFEIFYATEANTSANVSVGNCISCHTPPTFSDSRFHNAGISQLEYDGVHGKGAFPIFKVTLPLPGTVDEPSEDYHAIPVAGDSSRADLGFWWMAWHGDESEKRADETQEDYLKRMAGAFRTPALRNLGRTGPYMHNGMYATLEDAIRNKIKVSEMAKAGLLPGVDEAYHKMTITEADVEPLAAFLRSLDDVPAEDYRKLLINVSSPDFEALLSEE